MAIMTGAGAAIALSASQPATYDAAGYNALTYTNVDNPESISEIGQKSKEITISFMDSGFVNKRKGSVDGGTLSATFGYDLASAGQLLVRTANASNNNYSIRITDQNGAKTYFQAQVNGAMVDRGGADNVVIFKTDFMVTPPPTGTNLFVFV